jgi:hypothetical protein
MIILSVIMPKTPPFSSLSTTITRGALMLSHDAYYPADRIIPLDKVYSPPHNIPNEGDSSAHAHRDNVLGDIYSWPFHGNGFSPSLSRLTRTD